MHTIRVSKRMRHDPEYDLFMRDEIRNRIFLHMRNIIVNEDTIRNVINFVANVVFIEYMDRVYDRDVFITDNITDNKRGAEAVALTTTMEVTMDDPTYSNWEKSIESFVTFVEDGIRELALKALENGELTAFYTPLSCVIAMGMETYAQRTFWTWKTVYKRI